MWGEVLTVREVEYCHRLLDQLGGVTWCAPLLEKVRANWPPTVQTKPTLFELRFAAEIHAAGLTAEYEFSSNVGDSTVDFRLHAGGITWLLELVSILPSAAVRSATVSTQFIYAASLSSDAEDPRQSIAGEVLLAQQKIGCKALGKNGPIKFPVREPNQFHVVIADMRGFGLTGGDIWDFRQIAYGPAGVADSGYPIEAYWRTSDANSPVMGLLDPTNTKQRAALTVRERIHFLGFSVDEKYETGSLRSTMLFLPNPSLFESQRDASIAYNSYPLRQDAAK